MKEIGNGVAILHGTTERPASNRCGRTISSTPQRVAEPRAILVIDGLTRRFDTILGRVANASAMLVRPLSRVTRSEGHGSSTQCWRARTLVTACKLRA